MISFKKIKKNTLVIVLSVVVLALLTVNVTYSYVFSVKSTTNIQKFKAGTLDVTVTSTKMTSSLMPSTESDYPTAQTSTPKGDSNSYAKLVLKNTGSLDAKFSVSLANDTLPTGKTEAERVNMSYLRVGIYNETIGRWLTLGDTSSYSSVISNIKTNTDGSYPIISGTINSKATTTYRVYIWLIDTTPTTEISKLVNLKLNVKSTPKDQK